MALSLGTATDDHRSMAWIEGFSMFIAVAVVSSIQALNDYQKQKQFAELNNVAESQKRINLIRDG